MRTLRTMLLGLGGAAVLIAAPVSGVPAQGQTIKIGVLYDHTGPFSAAGSLNCWRGAKMIIDYVNERGGVLGKYKIVQVDGDSQSKAEVAINEAERLLNVEKVDILAGVYSSAHAVPLAEKVDKQKKFLWITTAISSKVFDGRNLQFTFRARARQVQDRPGRRRQPVEGRGRDQRGGASPQRREGRHPRGCLLERPRGAARREGRQAEEVPLDHHRDLVEGLRRTQPPVHVPSSCSASTRSSRSTATASRRPRSRSTRRSVSSTSRRSTSSRVSTRAPTRCRSPRRSTSRRSSSGSPPRSRRRSSTDATSSSRSELVLGKYKIVQVDGDSQSKAEVAINEAERLLNVEKVDILAGVYSSAHAVPLAEKVDKQKKFLWITTAISSKVFDGRNLQFTF